MLQQPHDFFSMVFHYIYENMTAPHAHVTINASNILSKEHIIRSMMLQI
uniref:Uncharacterized protein n=1 Tax=Arundo donax TaxID=35708 RepID=A0A0A9CDA4_ARUDO